MLKKYTVYIHTTPNNKKYVGITRLDVNERWRNGNGYKSNSYFTKAIKKYGWENIKNEIIYKEISQKEAMRKEIELIALFESDNSKYGYNLTSGGEKNKKPSYETLLKMRKPRSKEAIENMVRNHADVSGHRNPMYGKRYTEEEKERMSEALKGVMVGEKHPMYGRVRTGELAGHKKRVIQLSKDGEYIKKFVNITEASKETGAIRQHISKCCSGKRKTTGGYRWVYYEDYQTLL